MTNVKARVPSLAKIRKDLAPELELGGAARAVVFGSFARGDADESSDLDLMIVADSDRPFVERFKDFLGLWSVSPVKSLDVIVYTPGEIERMSAAGNPFVGEALANGKVIYEAGRGKRSRQVAAAGGGRSVVVRGAPRAAGASEFGPMRVKPCTAML